MVSHTTLLEMSSHGSNGVFSSAKMFKKVRKAAKIMHRYNKVPHLTQDTTSHGK